jgi:hypothetical protein
MKVFIECLFNFIDRRSLFNCMFFTKVVCNFFKPLVHIFFPPLIIFDMNHSSIVILFICRSVNVLFNFFRDFFKEFFMGLGEELGFFFRKCELIPCVILQVVVIFSLPPLMNLFQDQHLCIHNLFSSPKLGTTDNVINVVI